MNSRKRESQILRKNENEGTGLKRVEEKEKFGGQSRAVRWIWSLRIIPQAGMARSEKKR
ncbi:MAG: hypothetical protein ACLVG5_10035 [Clostridium sp.]